MGLGGLMVAAGGALGAAGRYGISLLPWRGEFPLLTLCTNFLGALAIGFVVGLAGPRRLSPGWTLFWKTGVCGGFTTFSTFSLESFTLLERGKWLLCGGSKRGAVPAGSGPGAEVERGCLNRPCMS